MAISLFTVCPNDLDVKKYGKDDILSPYQHHSGSPKRVFFFADENEAFSNSGTEPCLVFMVYTNTNALNAVFTYQRQNLAIAPIRFAQYIQVSLRGMLLGSDPRSPDSMLSWGSFLSL
jgi:hypothetical protein